MVRLMILFHRYQLCAKLRRSARMLNHWFEIEVRHIWTLFLLGTFLWATPGYSQSTQDIRIHQEIITQILPADDFRQEMEVLRGLPVLDISEKGWTALAEAWVQAVYETSENDLDRIVDGLQSHVDTAFQDLLTTITENEKKYCLEGGNCPPVECPNEGTDCRLFALPDSFAVSQMLDLALPFLMADLSKDERLLSVARAMVQCTQATCASAETEAKKSLKFALAKYRDAMVAARMLRAFQDAEQDSVNQSRNFKLPGALDANPRVTDIAEYLQRRCGWRIVDDTRRPDELSPAERECRTLWSRLQPALDRFGKYAMPRNAFMEELTAWLSRIDGWVGYQTDRASNPLARLQRLTTTPVRMEDVRGSIWHWQKWPRLVAVQCLEELAPPASDLTFVEGEDIEETRRRWIASAMALPERVSQCHAKLIADRPALVAAIRVTDVAGDAMTLQRRAELVGIAGDSIQILAPQTLYEDTSSGAHPLGIAFEFRLNPLNSLVWTLPVGRDIDTALFGVVMAQIAGTSELRRQMDAVLDDTREAAAAITGLRMIMEFSRLSPATVDDAFFSNLWKGQLSAELSFALYDLAADIDLVELNLGRGVSVQQFRDIAETVVPAFLKTIEDGALAWVRQISDTGLLAFDKISLRCETPIERVDRAEPLKNDDDSDYPRDLATGIIRCTSDVPVPQIDHTVTIKVHATLTGAAPTFAIALANPDQTVVAAITSLLTGAEGLFAQKNDLPPAVRDALALSKGRIILQNVCMDGVADPDLALPTIPQAGLSQCRVHPLKVEGLEALRIRGSLVLVGGPEKGVSFALGPGPTIKIDDTDLSKWAADLLDSLKAEAIKAVEQSLEGGLAAIGITVKARTITGDGSQGIARLIWKTAVTDAPNAEPVCIGPIRYTYDHAADRPLPQFDFGDTNIGRTLDTDSFECSDEPRHLIGEIIGFDPNNTNLSADDWNCDLRPNIDDGSLTLACRTRGWRFTTKDPLLRFGPGDGGRYGLFVQDWALLEAVLHKQLATLKDIFVSSTQGSLQIDLHCGTVELCPEQEDGAPRLVRVKATLDLDVPSANTPAARFFDGHCLAGDMALRFDPNILRWADSLKQPEFGEKGGVFGVMQGDQCVPIDPVDKLLTLLPEKLPMGLKQTVMPDLMGDVVFEPVFGAGPIACFGGTLKHKCLVVNVFLQEVKPANRLLSVVLRADGTTDGTTYVREGAVFASLRENLSSFATLALVQSMEAVNISPDTNHPNYKISLEPLSFLERQICLDVRAVWSDITSQPTLHPDKPVRFRTAPECWQPTQEETNALLRSVLPGIPIDGVRVAPSVHIDPEPRVDFTAEIDNWGEVTIGVTLAGELILPDNLPLELALVAARAHMQKLLSPLASILPATGLNWVIEEPRKQEGNVWRVVAHGDLGREKNACLQAEFAFSSSAPPELSDARLGRYTSPTCTPDLDVLRGIVPQNFDGRVDVKRSCSGLPCAFTLTVRDGPYMDGVLDRDGLKLSFAAWLAETLNERLTETRLPGLILQAKVPEKALPGRLDLRATLQDDTLFDVTGVRIQGSVDLTQSPPDADIGLSFDRATVALNEDLIKSWIAELMAGVLPEPPDLPGITINGVELRAEKAQITLIAKVTVDTGLSDIGVVSATIQQVIDFSDFTAPEFKTPEIEVDLPRVALSTAKTVLKDILGEAADASEIGVFLDDAGEVVITWTGGQAHTGNAYCFVGIDIADGAPRIDFNRFDLRWWVRDSTKCLEKTRGAKPLPAIHAFLQTLTGVSSGDLTGKNGKLKDAKLGETEFRSADGVFYSLVLTPDFDGLDLPRMTIGYLGITHKGLEIRSDPADAAASAVRSELQTKLAGLLVETASGLVDTVKAAAFDIPGAKITLISETKSEGCAFSDDTPAKTCITAEVTLPDLSNLADSSDEALKFTVHIPFQVTLELPVIPPVDLYGTIALTERKGEIVGLNDSQITAAITQALTDMLGKLGGSLDVKIHELDFKSDGLHAHFDLELDLDSIMKGIKGGAKGIRISGTRVDLPGSLLISIPGEVNVATGVTLTSISGWLPLQSGGTLGVQADWILAPQTGYLLRMPLSMQLRQEEDLIELLSTGSMIALSVLEVFRIEGAIGIDTSHSTPNWTINFNAGTTGLLAKVLDQQALLSFESYGPKFQLNSHLKVFSVELARTLLDLSPNGVIALSRSNIAFISSKVGFNSPDISLSDFGFEAEFSARIADVRLAGASFEASRKCGALVEANALGLDIAAYAARPEGLIGALPKAVAKAIENNLKKLLGDKPKFDRGPCQVVSAAFGGEDDGDTVPPPDLGVGDLIVAPNEERPKAPNTQTVNDIISDVVKQAVMPTADGTEKKDPSAPVLVTPPGGGTGDWVEVPPPPRFAERCEGPVYIFEPSPDNALCLERVQRKASPEHYAFNGPTRDDMTIQYDMGRLYRFCPAEGCAASLTPGSSVAAFLAGAGGGMLVSEESKNFLINNRAVSVILHGFGDLHKEGETLNFGQSILRRDNKSFDPRITNGLALSTCTGCHVGPKDPDGETPSGDMRYRVLLPKIEGGYTGTSFAQKDWKWRPLLFVSRSVAATGDHDVFILDGTAIGPDQLPTALPAAAEDSGKTSWEVFEGKQKIAAGCDADSACEFTSIDMFLLEPYALAQSNKANSDFYAAQFATLPSKLKREVAVYEDYFALPGGKSIPQEFSIDKIVPIPPIPSENDEEIAGGYIAQFLVAPDNGGLCPDGEAAVGNNACIVMRVISRQQRDDNLIVMDEIDRGSVYETVLNLDDDHSIRELLLYALQDVGDRPNLTLPTVISCDLQSKDAIEVVFRTQRGFLMARSDTIVEFLPFWPDFQTSLEGVQRTRLDTCPEPTADVAPDEDSAIGLMLDYFIDTAGLAPTADATGSAKRAVFNIHKIANIENKPGDSITLFLQRDLGQAARLSDDSNPVAFLLSFTFGDTLAEPKQQTMLAASTADLADDSAFSQCLRDRTVVQEDGPVPDALTLFDQMLAKEGLNFSDDLVACLHAIQDSQNP